MGGIPDEGKLRSELSDSTEETAAPAAPVMDAARQSSRRTGLSVTASVVAVLVVVIVSYGLLRLHAMASANGAASTSSSARTSAGTNLPARTFDRNHWQSGPAAPVLGQAYPFDLLVHCGLRYTTFGGKNWETTKVVAVPQATPDPVPGITEGMLVLPGYMTLQDPSTANFEGPRFASPVTFHVLNHPPPGCA